MDQNLNQPSPLTSTTCIAGAHRSGTSMVTQLLHACGLELGPQSDWMAAQADNPDGFWENLHFVAINDEVLNELGGAWDLPPPRGADFGDARLDPLRRKARVQLEKFAGIPLWGWKDPRNCLTLRFWQDLLPQLKVLLVVRNPLEVAYSMRKRNGTSYSFGLRLWEVYNRWLIAAAPAEHLLVTVYDSFFENPESELGRITDFLGLRESRIGNAVTLITPQRRHTTFSTEQMIDARVALSLIELYQQLVAQAKAKRPSLPSKPPPELLPGAASHLNTAIPEGEDVRRELAWLRGAEMKHREELAQRGGRITALQENVQRQEDARAALDRQVALLREHLSQVNREAQRQAEQARHQAERQAQQAQRQTQQAQRQAHNSRVILAQKEARIDQLVDDLRRQLLATKKLAWLLKEMEKAAAHLRSSRRWKMANPFASLREVFGGRKVAGYGHLEKVVADYAKWRSTHRDLEKIEERLEAPHLQPAARSTFSSDSNGSVAVPLEPPLPERLIQFPVHPTPDVSIIIPVFNQLRFTQACLDSIQEHQGNQNIEVIVVDDCSTDATRETVEKIPGLAYLRNEKNLGFIAACNHGANQARGKYLVFLNNDTLLRPGWLSSLLETFEFEPNAGIVGSKLLYPDGGLQEAGGIIWQDGSGWNRGKFQDARKPEYNFLCEVDYCSAACLMVPKSLFQRVGGFDGRYVPAYYEDTDLAFKVRAAGFKVLYQPLSEIIHFEGATGGTDVSSGAKRYQNINRNTFVQQWAEVLAGKPRNGDVAALEKLGHGRKRILVIDHHLPMPDRDSGSLRMFQVLTILHRLGHRVTFIPDNLSDIPPYGDELRKRGIEVIVRPHITSAEKYLESKGAKYDAVILSRCGTAEKNIAHARVHAPQSRIVFDTVDLHFLRTAREAELTRDADCAMRARNTQQQEYNLIDQADETWVVSEMEREMVLRDLPGRQIELVSNIVEIREPTTSFADRTDFLFIGSFLHPPNVDAVLFFAHEIYPLIARRLAGAKFYIIGNKPPAEVVGLANENIVVTGAVPDVRPFFESVRLSVAPIRYGAGVKGKINQSMGLGVPVVATSAAVEGMSLTHGEDVLVADEPVDFANCLTALYNSEEMWTRISKKSLEKTRSLYSAEVASRQLSRLFSEDRISHEVHRASTAVAR